MTFKIPQTHFAGSYKLRTTRENTSELDFDEKHTKAFWTKTKDKKV